MIRIWNNIVVDADKDNYIVGELRTVNLKTDDGVVQKEKIASPKYYTSFEAVIKYALELAVRKCVAEADVDVPESFVQEVRKAREEVKQALKSLGMEE